MKKTFALFTVFVLIFALMMPTCTFAGDNGNGNGNSKTEDKGAANKEEKAVKQDGSETISPESSTGSTDISEKDKGDKVQFKEDWKQLKEQYLDAVKGKDEELKTQVKKQIKEFCEQYRNENKKDYTEEETAKLEIVGNELKMADPSLTVLPVESIITVGKKMKLDTPPVVKSGRVLVPVRALSNAFGADVQWDNATQQVTIKREGIEIVLKLDSRTVLVNGVEVQLDVPAKSLNGRTVVPLRFIVEKLGLKVDYDDQTDTVIIEDGTSQTGQIGTGGDSGATGNTSTGTSATGSTTGGTSTTTGDTSTGTQTNAGTTNETNTGTSTGTGTNGQ